MRILSLKRTDVDLLKNSLFLKALCIDGIEYNVFSSDLERSRFPKTVTLLTNQAINLRRWMRKQKKRIGFS